MEAAQPHPSYLLPSLSSEITQHHFPKAATTRFSGRGRRLHLRMERGPRICGHVPEPSRTSEGCWAKWLIYVNSAQNTDYLISCPRWWVSEKFFASKVTRGEGDLAEESMWNGRGRAQTRLLPCQESLSLPTACFVCL